MVLASTPGTEKLKMRCALGSLEAGGSTALSVYGFGRGNYQDITLQSLSRNGNGTAAYIDGLDEARKLFQQEFARQLFPSPTM